jgi:acetyltransferase
MFEAVVKGTDRDLAVFGVNPKSDGRNGFHPTLQAATDAYGSAIDLAVLCIPAEATPAALRDAADCGVGAALICSGGFAETGPGGIALQSEIANISTTTGIRVLGPNTSGFFRPGHTTVSFVPTVEHISAGTVAVVAASGGMNHALSFLLSEHGVGVGLGIGLGNCVDVTAADVLDYLSNDPSITAVALHVESVDDGQALQSAVRALSETKPVVAVVVGRSDVSAFSESHTGALATSWRTARALLTQAGAVVVDSEQQLVDALAVLSRIRLRAGSSPGIALVTAQAGPGLMALDALLDHGVSVPTLHADTQARLSQLLPPLTFQANPVDTGRPGPSFPAVLAATAEDPAIDALAVYALAEPDAIDLAEAVRQSGVHVRLPVVLGIGGPGEVVSKTSDAAALINVPVLPSPSALATGISALVEDAKLRQLNCADNDHQAPAATGLLSLPADEGSVKDLLDTLGIATPPRRTCRDRAAAHQALCDLEPPVAVKVLDATVLHKTEIGGVHLGVRTAAELDAALDALDAINAPAYLVEAMVEPGVDMFLGARRDPVFGPIVVAGLGGTAAEAIGDVAIRSHPLGHAAAAAMLDDLQFSAMLNGWRGGPVLDRGGFARVALALADYLARHPEIGDIEVNPLRLTRTGLIALDAVVVAAPDRHADPEREF